MPKRIPETPMATLPVGNIEKNGGIRIQGEVNSNPHGSLKRLFSNPKRPWARGSAQSHCESLAHHSEILKAEGNIVLAFCDPYMICLTQ